MDKLLGDKLLDESLFKEKKLNISIDSKSFQELLFKKNKNAENILKSLTFFNKNDNCYEIIRSPLETEPNELLKKIPYFTIKETQESFLHYGIHDLSALYTHNPFKMSEHPNNILSYTPIRFTEKITLEKGKEIFDKVDLDENEKNSAFLMVIQPFLISNTKIFITENPLILKSKKKFYDITDNPPIIVNLRMAKEIIGLYIRYKNIYDINIHSNDIEINFPIEKHEYYEYSLLSKIPYLPFRSDKSEYFTKSLLSRFLNLLMSLDEIGIQYYNGTNKNSMFNSLYHFNYLLSLITGIFDNLAHITKNKYYIHTKFDSEITLNPNSKQIIRNGLKDNNKSLYNHLVDNSIFIGLVHDLRNIILHNEMLDGIFHKTSYEVAKGVKIQRILFEKLKQCPNDMNKTKRQEFWGVLSEDHADDVYVDIFRFAKACCIEIFEFTNIYMKLMGQNNFIKELKKEKHRNYEVLELFEEYNFDLVLD